MFPLERTGISNDSVAFEAICPPKQYNNEPLLLSPPIRLKNGIKLYIRVFKTK